MARYNSKHGHSGSGGTHRKASKTYNAWVSMKRRCYDPTQPNYSNYGGRGITYDARWESFANFLEDMGEAPEGLTLERKDNNGNYCKDNCEWATVKKQANNRRSNRTITFNGETLTMAAWADRIGVSRQCLRQRIDVLGWSIEDALESPSWKYKNR